jgi:hypothetical protein
MIHDKLTLAKGYKAVCMSNIECAINPSSKTLENMAKMRT